LFCTATTFICSRFNTLCDGLSELVCLPYCWSFENIACLVHVSLCLGNLYPELFTNCWWFSQEQYGSVKPVYSSSDYILFGPDWDLRSQNIFIPHNVYYFVLLDNLLTLLPPNLKLSVETSLTFNIFTKKTPWDQKRHRLFWKCSQGDTILCKIVQSQIRHRLLRRRLIWDFYCKRYIKATLSGENVNPLSNNNICMCFLELPPKKVSDNKDDL